MNRNIKLRDILDVKAIQSLMNHFYALTNIGIGIIDIDGEVLVATGWQDICTLFHRQNELTRKYCIQSDLFLTGNVRKGEFLEYKCKNNLRDIITPIYVSNQHIGSIYFGQFFYDEEIIDENSFYDQASLYGFDKQRYLESLNKVPRISRDKVNNVIQFYSKFAGIISSLLDANLQLKDTLEENKVVIGDLKRSNKDLERFAYISSHDLKEPLRMISSYVQLFLRNYSGKFDAKGEEYASYIIDGVRRMYQLIDDIVKYSHLVNPSANSFLLTDFNELFKDVKTDLRILLRENSAVIHVDKLPEIYANPTQIRLVFQNLLHNAIKFRSDKQPEIYVCCRKASEGWLFSVRDNGIGIDSEYHEKIFELFNRLNNREFYPGSGIGLAQCRRIIEQHGGRIWVESVPGEGSVFYFLISAQLA